MAYRVGEFGDRETTQLVLELNLEKTPSWDHPFFTGWKEVFENPHSDPLVGTGKYIGQIVCREPNSKTHFLYVNLPGMESGRIQQGAVMNIGKDRLTEPPTLEAMREMLQKGLAKLKEMMEEYTPF